MHGKMTSANLEGGSLSRGAYRHQTRRIENVINTNRVINAIKSMVGFKSPKAAGPTMVQDKIMKSILQIFAENRDVIYILLHVRPFVSF